MSQCKRLSVCRMAYFFGTANSRERLKAKFAEKPSTHSRDKQEWIPTTPCFDSSNTWYDLSASLYHEWEVRADEEKDRQLAPSLGVVARSGFLARAGDRRLLTGGASPVRIFCCVD